MNQKIMIELSRDELNIIIIGMTASQYPIKLQNDAFNLVLKLRDKLRETA